jgi:DNA-directed RNA polymerase specialized sigma24 family protein
MAGSDEHSGPEVKAQRIFATTHWSLVRAAGRPEAPEAAAALEKLCQAYWYPVYAHIRRWGFGAEDARDLTQGFFAQLLRENTVAAADPERGRFRCFLLGVLKRFLVAARVHAGAQKRGVGRTVVSWEQDVAEARLAQEPADERSPDRLFEWRWALALLEQVTVRLRAEYETAGRRRWFDVLKPYITAEPDAPSYAETAAALGVSESAVKSAIYRLRQRYHAVLRDEVAETVGDAAELDDELRHLRAVFSAR